MPQNVISVEDLCKSYQLGVIGTGTFYGDLKRWWARQRGKPDPYLKVGEADHGNRNGETIWALKDVTFSVQQGEALGIIGRNGAGKSTLLKILSQVTAPTSGIAKVKGRIASLLEVGTGFHPDLTGHENIYLNGAILGMPKAEIRRKFDEIVEFSGIQKFIDTPVKRYSSGMYVRLAFAVAAHLDPDILLVDEVLAVGDAAFQAKCLGKMGEVTHEGRTVIFVSHNMGAISRFCSRVILLKEGKIFKDEATQEAIDAYYETLHERNRYASNGNRIIDAGAGFVRWSTGNTHDPACYQVYSRDPVNLAFLLSVKEPVEQAYFGIAFYSAEGQLVWAMRSEDADKGFQDLTPGDYEVNFSLPTLPLRPGHYRLQVSVNSKLKQYDVWDVEPNLEVLAKNESGLPVRWQGIMNMPGEFSIMPTKKGN